MNPECYKCFSVGLGIFMLMWMITTLHLSLDGINLKYCSTENSKEKCKPAEANYHLYRFKNEMDKLRDNKEIAEAFKADEDTQNYGFELWSKSVEYSDKVERGLSVRCVLIVLEIIMVFIAIGVLGRRVAASKKSVLEAVACGIVVVPCFICGSIEAWFASGKAMSYEEVNHRNFRSLLTTTTLKPTPTTVLVTTDGWVAATVFLFLGIILWILNAGVAMMNPGSADDSKGRTGSHINLAGHPSANLQPYVGNPQFPQPRHQ